MKGDPTTRPRNWTAKKRGRQLDGNEADGEHGSKTFKEAGLKKSEVLQKGVLNLHFVFAPHAEEKTVLPVWERLWDLHQQGISPLSIGAEIFETKKQDRATQESRWDQLGQKIARHLGPRKPPQSANARINLRHQLAQLQPELDEKEGGLPKTRLTRHFLGMTLVAARFGTPIRILEHATPASIRTEWMLECHK